MESTFTNIYEHRFWGDNGVAGYNGSSGSGSDVDQNKDTYVPVVQNFIIENGVKTVVDLGCGDFKCGPFIYEDLDVLYTGYDAYRKLVDYNSITHSAPKYTFKHLDFCYNKESIESADLCVLKDVIQHWPLANIYEFFDYLVETKKFKYILVCNCCAQTTDDTDIRTGQWRPLSCNFLPLKKYNPVMIYNYGSKEVSVIHS
jgi:hypothetical protein